MKQLTLCSCLFVLIGGCTVVPPMPEPPASHPASPRAVESPIPPRPEVLSPAMSAADENPPPSPDKQPPQPQAPVHDHSHGGGGM